MLHEFLRPGVWPAKPVPDRFASLIEHAEPSGCEIALVGLPDDTGVRLNNGRPGANEGPTAIRAALHRLGVREPHGWAWPRVYDAGDVEIVRDDLHQTHDRVTAAVKAVIETGLIPIGLGGGHDLTFPFVRAVSERIGPMHGVSFDPHLDVRETDGSGMPFRRLLETDAATAHTIHRFDPMVNSSEHTSWFLDHGGRIGGHHGFTDPAYVSFDLDVIDAAYAPGVSALNPCGWTPNEAIARVVAAGRDRAVRCFDVMELSPPNDDNDRTARLAARLVLAFLRGFAERPE
ncbi:MAG: arginase family protein [Planctomycetota bacterium]